MQNAGSVKEAALLKATVESLRAGLREKEDAVTELVKLLLFRYWNDGRMIVLLIDG